MSSKQAFKSLAYTQAEQKKPNVTYLPNKFRRCAFSPFDLEVVKQILQV